MYRALALKELRETWWMAAIACIVVGCGIWNELGLNLDLEQFRVYWIQGEFAWFHQRLPFSNGEFAAQVMGAAAVLGAVLGLWQTLFETVNGTWPFLMHRPITRRGVLLTKLATGTGLIVVSTALPVVLFALCLAAFGAQGRPFRWHMTVDMWVLWCIGLTAYPAAFLCGLREARWLVSRWWPLVPVAFLPVFPVEFAGTLRWILLALVVDVILLAAIAHASRDRDYA